MLLKNIIPTYGACIYSLIITEIVSSYKSLKLEVIKKLYFNILSQLEKILFKLGINSSDSIEFPSLSVIISKKSSKISLVLFIANKKLFL